MIRTRFAPSPTGFLHIGSIRTTIFAYLFAKHNGGKFIVRVEDTDQERFVPGAIESMLKTLEWVGMVPDEGPVLKADGTLTEKGEHGPYVQSKRLDIYKKYVAELLKNGHAYYAFDSAEELAAMRERLQARKLPTKYDRANMRNQFTLSAAEVDSILKSDAPRVVRLKVPDEGDVSFNDIVHGKTVFACKEVDDQVLLKSDGFPTYHLAVVVDDHLMEITHVIRGDDWISSTPKHLLLYRAFNWQPPEHAHVPNVFGNDKLKLSKRRGDVSVEGYKEKGYLPEALINFLAFLGWNPGTEQEIFSKDELIKEFKLEKVSKAGAVFNVEKLNWYNKEYIKRLTATQLAERAKPFFEAQGVPAGENFEAVIGLEKERVTTLAELPSAVKFIYELPDYSASLLVGKKSSANEAKKALSLVAEKLAAVPLTDWDKNSLEQLILPWIKEQGLTNAAVLWPLRVALSGQQNSPGPLEIAAVLGPKISLERIKKAASRL